MKPIADQPKKTIKAIPRDYSAPTTQSIPPRPTAAQQSQKRSAPTTSHIPLCKKPKLNAPYKDVPIAEASKYGTLQDYAFFDKVIGNDRWRSCT